MSVTVHSASVRSQSASNPTHEAATGVLHVNTATGVVFCQIDRPSGTNWAPLAQAASNVVFVEDERAFNPGCCTGVFTEV